MRTAQSSPEAEDWRGGYILLDAMISLLIVMIMGIALVSLYSRTTGQLVEREERIYKNLNEQASLWEGEGVVYELP